MAMLDRIANGRTDLVYEYVAKGNPFDAKDPNGVSLIRWCAYYGDVSAIRFLLERGESLQSLGDNFDLNGAAFHGHWRLCQFLIKQEAKVNHALPGTGETPLHSSFCTTDRIAHDSVVEILLANGANPNAVTAPGVPTGSFMRDCRTRGETPLHRAAAFGSEHSIQELLNAGAKLDVKDINGDSPLTWASWHLRSASILRMLCYNGFRIHDAHQGMRKNLQGKPTP